MFRTLVNWFNNHRLSSAQESAEYWRGQSEMLQSICLKHHTSSDRTDLCEAYGKYLMYNERARSLMQKRDGEKALLTHTLARLKSLQASIGESNHQDADEALCDFIRELGYPEVAAEFDKIHKWYA